MTELGQLTALGMVKQSDTGMVYIADEVLARATLPQLRQLDHDLNAYMEAHPELHVEVEHVPMFAATRVSWTTRKPKESD